RVAMANWTPEGFVGELLRAHAAIVAPPQGVPSPLAWGQEDIVGERFAEETSSLILTRHTLELRFALSPAGVAELFATCYGPTVATLKATDTAGVRRLRAE